MTRIKLSAAILLGLVIMSIVSGAWIIGSCRDLQIRSIQVEEAWLAGDVEEAYRLACRLEEDWESFRRPAAVFLRSRELLEIDRITSRVRYRTASGGELQPELAELRHMLEQLRSSVIPRPETVL
ncbi:MAG TPA: hypothetical protein DCZ62_07240 [Ruminococcus sp.]|nr:hypothetical protein [Ruminococcus sp.]